jgi:hypothetical protein
MKKLSYTLITLAAIGFGTLPAQAVNQPIETEQTANVQSAKNQIKEATTLSGCWYVPGWGWRCN